MTTLALTGGIPQDDNLRNTHVGMAHFAGTGPQGATRKQCKQFKVRKEGAVDGHCQKFNALTRSRRLNFFPSLASACRHFE